MSEPVTAVLTRPTTTAAEATGLLRREWAIEGDLAPLPSERDRNFVVRQAGQPRFVLKLSNTAEDRAFLDLQHRAMAALAAAGVPCQQVVPAGDRQIVAAGPGGSPPLARLLTWLPGSPLASIPPAGRPPALLADLGRTMGRTAAALRRLEDPAAVRSFQWDPVRGATVIEAHADAVADPARRAILGAWRRRFATRLAPALAGLRRSIIHNDANDHNVVVDPVAGRVSGLLDFGDMVLTVTANELAVACAYAMLGASEPVAVAAAVASGFEAVLPLTDEERDLLLDLVALRLCTSVALSAHQAGLDPTDAYLTVSEGPAWRLLADLATVDPAHAAARLRGAA